MAKKRVVKKINKKVIFALFAGAGVLVLVLVGLIMSSLGFFKNSELEMFTLKDECSLVMGNLIHQIRDGGECRIKCVNECDVRNMDFVEFEFLGKNNDCNSCECWCD
jgi:hypothetical protein